MRICLLTTPSVIIPKDGILEAKGKLIGLDLVPYSFSVLKIKMVD
jgi:hypothetical protein